MKKYDFKVELIDVFSGALSVSVDKKLESILNEYGSEGYELVSSVQYKMSSKYAFVFQKEV
ncbi:hypothetical protein N9546_01210 [Flavobacteriaceae bacterium]|nr:hypothetical protein [Flavobacteriaceae bacterium]